MVIYASKRWSKIQRNFAWNICGPVFMALVVCGVPGETPISSGHVFWKEHGILYTQNKSKKICPKLEPMFPSFLGVTHIHRVM